jgi:hypothetical protein
MSSDEPGQTPEQAIEAPRSIVSGSYDVAMRTRVSPSL